MWYWRIWQPWFLWTEEGKTEPLEQGSLTIPWTLGQVAQDVYGSHQREDWPMAWHSCELGYHWQSWFQQGGFSSDFSSRELTHCSLNGHCMKAGIHFPLGQLTNVFWVLWSNRVGQLWLFILAPFLSVIGPVRSTLWAKWKYCLPRGTAAMAHWKECAHVCEVAALCKTLRKCCPSLPVTLPALPALFF